MDITDKSDLARLRNRVYLFVGLPLLIVLITLALIKEPDKGKKGSDKPRQKTGRQPSTPRVTPAPKTPAPKTPAQKTPARAKPKAVLVAATQTRGNVRITLLSIARGTTFEPTAAQPLLKVGGSKATPQLRLVYLVECLGEGPVLMMNFGELKIADAEGQPVPIGPAAKAMMLPIDETTRKLCPLPELKSPDRAKIRIHTFSNVSPVGPIDITIRAGFNDVVESFHFAGVPL